MERIAHESLKINAYRLVVSILAITGAFIVLSMFRAEPAYAQATCPDIPDNYGVATKQVNVTTTSTYRVWSRISTANTANDSYFLSIDGVECGIVVGDTGVASADEWTWVDYRDGNTSSKIEFSIPAGTHTFTLSGREPSVNLDRILLLSDTACLPTGTGDNCAVDTIAPSGVAVTSPTADQTVSGNVTITASAADDVGVTKVEFYANGSTLIGEDTAPPFSMVWDSSSVSQGSNTLSVKAFDAAGNNTTSSQVSVTVSIPTPVGAPWTSQDVGSPSLAGSASFDNDTYTVTGSGVDIWSTSDEFQFVHQDMSGDGVIVARVVSAQNTHAFAKAAVMIREDLTGPSKNVIMGVNANNGITFQHRTTTGDVTTSTRDETYNAPIWVRLTRTGNTIVGAYSENGTDWTDLGTTTVSMASDVKVGLAVTSHDMAKLMTATFDNVSLNGSQPANQATVSIAPPTGSYAKDDTLTVTVEVDSGANEIDSVRARVQYDPAQLQYVSSDETTSDFNTDASLTTGANYVDVERGTTVAVTNKKELIKLMFTVLGSSGSTEVSIVDGETLVLRGGSELTVASDSATYTLSSGAKVGDINNDNSVNIFDLSILLGNWNTSNATGDINGDSVVNIFDLSILLGNWGA